MIGRNDPCPCGSGKKYKKCCQSKNAVTIETVQQDELERVLQTFYDEYPKRKDIPDYLKVANEWKHSLGNHLPEEMIEAIAMDEFFFHHRIGHLGWLLGQAEENADASIRFTSSRVVAAPAPVHRESERSR